MRRLATTATSQQRGSFLVTGAGSGLGAAVARRLRQDGFGVVLVDRQDASALAAELGAVWPGPCDVTSESDIKAAVAAAPGTLRGAVNAAGIATAARVLKKGGGVHSLEDFMRVLHVNVGGTFNVTRLVAERIHSQPADPTAPEKGVIVNTASIAAFDGQIGQAAYAASKGAVAALTLPLAREFAAYGIRVCTIAPGIFDTPMLAGLPQPAREALAASVPFPKRLGHPQDNFAALVSHIIHNTYLNGEVIRIDGALRMM